MKRIISTVVAVVIFLCFLPIMNHTALAANLTLTEVQNKFPDGAYWNHADDKGSSNNRQDGISYTPCSNGHTSQGTSSTCNYFGNPDYVSAQCRGFADKVTYDIYGKASTNWTKFTKNMSEHEKNIKPGDVLIIEQSGKSLDHAVFVTAVNGDVFTIGEANYDGHCRIRWNYSLTRTGTRSDGTGIYKWGSYNNINIYSIRSAPSALIGATNNTPSVSTYTKPASPADLTASKASETTVKISWSASANATSYKVEYKTHGNPAQWVTDNDYNGGTSYISTGLGKYDVWEYRIQAVNSAGSSGWVEVVYTKPSPSASTTTQTPTGISLSQTSLTITNYACYYLTATITPSDVSNKTITWKSSNPSVATVDSTGMVEPKANGTTTITATTANNLSSSCVVTVKFKEDNLAAPTGLSATSASSDNNSARISWNPVAGATSYQVQYWSPANNEWRNDSDYSSGTSYITTGLSANTSWRYHVRAVNSAGYSDWSEVIYTKPSAPAQPQVPPAPTGLSATRYGSEAAVISWNAVTGATSYEAQYYSPSAGSWKTDSDYSNKTATSYTSTGLGLYSSYNYRVRAVNSAGTSAWSEVTYYKTTTPTTPTVSVPSAPTGLNATKSGTETAVISWYAVSGATSYEVQYYSPSAGSWKNDSDYTNKTATSYTSTGLGLYNSYNYRVRAVNSAGASAWSEVTYTKPSAPTVPVNPPPVDNSYKLDGYDCTKIERNMTVNVGSGSTLRFARAVSATDNDYAAIPNGNTVYVYGVTISTYPNKSGTYINWAKISYNGQVGWVNYAYLK